MYRIVSVLCARASFNEISMRYKSRKSGKETGCRFTDSREDCENPCLSSLTLPARVCQGVADKEFTAVKGKRYLRKTFLFYSSQNCVTP